MVTLATNGMLLADDLTWQIAYVGHRRGDGLDVIVAVSPYGVHARTAYRGFRRNRQGQRWLALSGRWYVLTQAVYTVPRTYWFDVMDVPAQVLSLLDLTDEVEPELVARIELKVAAGEAS